MSPGRGAACCAPTLTSPAGPLAVAGTTGPAPNAQPRLDGESNLPTLDRRADERVVRGQRRADQAGGDRERGEASRHGTAHGGIGGTEHHAQHMSHLTLDEDDADEARA